MYQKIYGRIARFTTSSLSPTSSVRKAHQFDEKKLFEFLRQSSIISNEDITIKQFSHGQSNPTFLLLCSVTNQKLVLRKQPPGVLLKGAHAVDRESYLMTSLRDSPVPVPKTRIYCSDSSIIGTPFYCYDYVDGRFFNDPGLPSISNANERSMIYNAMIDTLARIHSLDISKFKLDKYGVRITPSVDRTVMSPYVIRQLRTWTKQYRASETEAIPDMEYLIDTLPKLFPVKGESSSTLVHGDFRIDNMIFHEERSEVAAVLDWELSTLGDPLSDLAYFCIPYFVPSNNPFFRGVADLDLVERGIPSIKEVVGVYGNQLTHHSKGLSTPPTVELLDYYLAFSFFRSCAILQGVYKRSLAGNASASNAGGARAGAVETAKIGSKLLKKYAKSVASP